MKKLKIRTRQNKEEDNFMLEITGTNFMYILFTKFKNEAASSVGMVEEIINYYEFGKQTQPLELIEREITPNHIFYTILSKRKTHSIQLSKQTNKYNCTCEHGALHSVNNNQLCKHIKHCMKIETKYKLHKENKQ